jgi:hypothetical protein
MRLCFQIDHTGEDLEVWKIHMDISFFDTGSLPITARELRTKMSSRQKIYSSAGIADANFEEVKHVVVLCDSTFISYAFVVTSVGRR